MRAHGLMVLMVGLLIAADEKKDDKNAKDERPYLGVEVRDNVAMRTVMIGEVDADSPAAKAGLKAGDQITKVNDTAVNTARGVVAAVSKHKAGDEITIAVRRGGKDMNIKVTLGSRKKGEEKKAEEKKTEEKKDEKKDEKKEDKKE